MNKQISESFIAELNSTIKEYASQSETAPELKPLVELSNHMVDAVEALNSKLLNNGGAPRAA